MTAEAGATGRGRKRAAPSRGSQTSDPAPPTTEHDPDDPTPEDPTPDEIPPPPRPSPDSDDDPEDPRRVAHELVAQAHAVLALAGRDDVLPDWCPEDLQPAVRESAAELAQAVGRLHAEIASGEYDARLREAGIGGLAGKPKRKWFRRALERLSRLVGAADQAAQRAAQALRGQQATVVRAWLKSAAGWGKLALDSISSEVPGGHIIKEALELVIVGVDTLEAEAITNPTDNSATT
jgi:hypothetical protein